MKKDKPNPKPCLGSTKVVLDDNWIIDEPEDGVLEMAGKDVFLIQVPATLPIKKLDGLQVPRRAKKSKRSVSLSWQEKDTTKTVEITCQKIDPSFTLMIAQEGKYSPCDAQPKVLLRGWDSLPVNVPGIDLVEESMVHAIPDGLRQRFKPIGWSGGDRVERRKRDRKSHEDSPAKAKKHKRKKTQKQSEG